MVDFGSRGRFNQCAECRGGEKARTVDALRRKREQDTEIDVAAGIKRCGQCRFTLPRDRFHTDANRRDGRFPYCKPCRAERTGKVDPERKRYQTEHEFATVVRAHRNASDVARDRYLRQNYGITTADYERLLLAQGGRCAICRIEPCDSVHTTSRRFLHVDHDHSCCVASKSCGQCVRGLLCGRCNNALGHFADDPVLLMSALDYIQRWSDGR